VRPPRWKALQRRRQLHDTMRKQEIPAAGAGGGTLSLLKCSWEALQFRGLCVASAARATACLPRGPDKTIQKLSSSFALKACKTK
jgi:hypothetical protein